MSSKSYWKIGKIDGIIRLWIKDFSQNIILWQISWKLMDQILILKWKNFFRDIEFKWDFKELIINIFRIFK